MENGVTKQLKMRERKMEEDKEEIAQTGQCYYTSSGMKSVRNGSDSEAIAVTCLLMETPKQGPPGMPCSFPSAWSTGRSPSLREVVSHPEVSPNSCHPTAPALGKWRLPNRNSVCGDLSPAVSQQAQECSGMLLLRRDKPRPRGIPQGMGAG